MEKWEEEIWIKITQADQEAQKQGFPSAFGEPEEDEDE